MIDSQTCEKQRRVKDWPLDTLWIICKILNCMTSGMDFFFVKYIFSLLTLMSVSIIFFYCGILQVIQQQHNLVFIFNRHWSNNKATIIVFCLANNIFMVARVVLARRTRRIMIVGWVFCCPLRVVVRKSAKYCTLQNFVCKGYTKLDINLILGSSS